MDGWLDFFGSSGGSDEVARTSIWALTTLVLALIFRAPLVALIAASDGLEAELGPVKLRLRRSVAALQSAAEVKASQGLSRKLSDRELRNVARGAAKAGSDRLAHRLILWVDDHPTNNKLEREAFENLGVRFVNALSTDEAVRLLSATTFDLVISDMGRGEEPMAGIELLQRVRGSHPRLPVIFYTSQDGVARASNAGAAGATAHPDELYQLVLGWLTR